MRAVAPLAVVFTALFAMLAFAQAPAAPVAPAPAAGVGSVVVTVGVPPADAKPPAASKQGLELYAQRCAFCHGASGRGDGVAAKGFNPPARDLTDPLWQRSVDDNTLLKAIADGGAAVGKSPLMPGVPDLKGSPAKLAALKDVVRSLRDPQGSLRLRAESGGVVRQVSAKTAPGARLTLGDLPAGTWTLQVFSSAQPAPLCETQGVVEPGATLSLNCR